MKKLISAAAALVAAASAFAQVNVKTEAGDLTLRLQGRTNIDFGSYLTDKDVVSEDDDRLRGGLMVNDTRLGVTASFDEQWQAKIEVSFANKAVAFKDLWIGYKASDNSFIQAGHFMVPFGAKILGLSYKFVEDASADYTFCPGRRMGITYAYTSDPFNITAGAFSDNTADTKTLNSGYSLGAKAIYRPWVEKGNVLHFGFAPLFTTPQKNSAVTFKSTIPTTIESNALAAYTCTPHNYWRFELEAIYISGKLYAEAHHITTQMNLPGSDNKTLHGSYLQASYLLIGDTQNYNKKTGLASPASAKNLEVLARWSNTKLDSTRGTDFTLGLNYFFNKYVNVKLNYIHAIGKYEEQVNARDVEDVKTNHDLVQARLQFSF